ncbi:MAG: MFS transporter, partial [Clostridiales bacterium]|nr:MFS transporter [Clostridiales bacterium]
LIPLRFIPITRGHAHRGGGGAGGKTVGRGGGVNLTMIVKNRRLMLLLGFGLFHFMFVSCQNTYFSVYYATERGMNAGIGMYGLFFALSISGEALVMILGHKLFSRLNVYTVFSVIPLAGSLRALIVYLAPNPYIMMVSAVFHGLMFGLLWMHAAPYIGRIVPNEMRATGQASWSVMVSGLGPVIGSTLGGLLTNFIDIRGVFLFVSCALSLVFIVFSFLFRRQRAIDRAEGFIAQ